MENPSERYQICYLFFVQTSVFLFELPQKFFHLIYTVPNTLSDVCITNCDALPFFDVLIFLYLVPSRQKLLLEEIKL